MSWLEQLQVASFRKVKFQVDTLEHHAGDNVVLREYPFQDLPTVFRMGESAEEIKFSAYVIGPDYIAQRDALREVLTGEGLLQHPTAGLLKVFVMGKYTIKENPAAEGGMARFDLSFVRAEVRRFPVGVTNTPAAAVAAAQVARAAAIDNFAAKFSVARKSGWVGARVLRQLTAVLDKLAAPIKLLTAGLDGIRNGIIGKYQLLRQGLSDLARTPRLLAYSINQLLQLPQDLSNAVARDLITNFGGLFKLQSKLPQTDFETPIVPPVGGGLVMFGLGDAQAQANANSSASRKELAVLNAAVVELVETLATCAFVEACAAYEMVGYDEALQLRAQLNEQCTRLLTEGSASAAPESLPAQSWHDAVVALHAAGLADLQARSSTLARLSSYTPEAWLPVWVVSYQLYGTAQYADQILAMNPHITHPLLVPPGVALRVPLEV
jgi:prophage DNA circulation protein